MIKNQSGATGTEGRQASAIRACLLSGVIWAAAAAAAAGQPIIPEAPAGSLGVCDASNPYPRAKIATEANADDCNTDTLGAGTEEVLCVCMPDGLGGYSWEAVGGGGSAATTEAGLEAQITDVADIFTDNDGELTDDDLTDNLITDLAGISATSGPSSVVATAGTFTGGRCAQWTAGGDVSSASAACVTNLDSLSDVEIVAPTGGRALVFESGLPGAWKVSTAGACLSDGTNCPPGGAATSIDADGDGTDEVSVAALTIEMDPDDDGFADVTVGSDYVDVGAGGEVRFGDSSNRLVRLATRVALFSLGSLMVDVYGGSKIETGFPLQSTSSARPAIMFGTTPTSSVPVFLPRAVDADTGFGADGSDTAWITAGGVAVIEADNDGTTTGATIRDVLALVTRATAPASCALGDLYMDTSGALCGCNTSAAWELVHDLSDGGAPNCT